MTALAEIASGATAGSTQVTVTLTAANGTTILVHRGGMLLGSGTLSGGQVTVTLNAALAEGDVLLASATTKGTLCGNPVVVSPNSVTVTGWKSPSEVYITQEDGTQLTMPIDQFVNLYKYYPASLFDPIGTRAVLQPEYVAVDPKPIGFDVIIDREAGTTSISVVNVTGTIGGTLIRWNNGTWGNTAARSYTSAQTVTIDVRGASNPDTVYSRKTINVSILSAPIVPSSQIKGSLFSIFSAESAVMIQANATVQLEARITAVSSTWQTMVFSRPDLQYYTFGGVSGGGTYTYQLRVAGDTNAANWLSVTFTT